MGSSGGGGGIAGGFLSNPMGALNNPAGVVSGISNAIYGTPGGNNQGTKALGNAIDTSQQTLTGANQIQGQQQAFLNAMQPQYQSFGNQLASQAMGQSISPAMANAMQQNNAAQIGMAKSQRGIDPALAARNAAQIGAQNQQAAILGGTANAQNAYSNFMGQNQGYNTSLMGNVTNAQGTVNQAAGAQASNQAALSQQQSQNNQGFMRGVSSMVAAMAHGGQVPQNYAGGGNVMVNPFQQVFQAPAPVQQGENDSLSELVKTMAPKKPGLASTVPGADTLLQAPQNSILGTGAPAEQPGMFSPGSLTTPDPGAGGLSMPVGVLTKAHGGQIPRSFVGQHLHTMKSGGHVPGPNQNGTKDSLKNDTVPTMLSPGEIVLPKSVVNSNDPANNAAKFVQAILQKQGKR